MTSQPSETKAKSSEPPAPEVLHPKADNATPTPSTAASSTTPKLNMRRHATYRPSHKATFIGLAVVVAVLAINAGIITFVVRGQGLANAETSQSEVTISPGVLNSLGVSRNSIGNTGAELVVNPNSRFNGKVVIGSDVSVGGELKLNSKFSASDASLAKLEAGDTSLGQLNVNGDGTVSTLNLRKDLNVVGATRLQGPVTISQLLTVNNNVNVAGSLSVGGTLSARGFQASSLVSDTTLTIGGHVITRGPAPGVGPGNALGNNGTVSISGNDAAGTVAANIGTGAGGGIIAQVAFRQQYSNTPHVVVTGVGAGIGSVYVNRSVGGFSIGVNGPLAPGGYAFDYIVMQ
jgi:hypothetical protein